MVKVMVNDGDNGDDDDDDDLLLSRFKEYANGHRNQGFQICSIIIRIITSDSSMILEVQEAAVIMKMKVSTPVMPLKLVTIDLDITLLHISLGQGTLDGTCC